ncbi:hypothetical protein GCM10009836_03770 [Pseudonocardia ailaonensis]|uniref:Uncharacterized protein n=1 Tax=Pseudonocardia ailaonensis TaxID=367279 RepID=A0ABN2MKH9_9PSEU
MARHEHTDPVAGPDPGVDEDVGERVHPRVELRVGQLCPLGRHHRDGLRGGRGLRVEQHVERRVDHLRLDVERGARDGPGRAREQGEIGEPRVGRRRDGAQRGAEDGHEPLRRGRVEQVGGVGEEPGDARRRLLEGEVEIDLRGAQCGRAWLDVDAVEDQSLGLRTDVVREHDLEERVAVRGAIRAHGRHHLLERRVLVGEPVQDGASGRGQHVAERVGAAEPVPDRESRDEVADHVLEAVGRAAADRGAEDDVVRSAEHRHRDRGGRVGEHEHRGAGLRRDPAQPVDGVGVQRERHVRATVARLRGPAPVHRDRRLRRGVVQRVPPVTQVAGERGVRVRGVAERPALPERVVRVLHGQRRPVRGVPGRAGTVRRGQVAEQRPERPLVHRVVVHGQHDHTLRGGRPEDRGADREVAGQVERALHELRDPRVEVAGKLLGGHGHGGAIGGDDPLVQPPLAFDEQRAQRLVAGDHVTERGAEGDLVEVPDQAHHDRDDVPRARAAQAVDEPERLLAVGHRQRGGALGSLDRAHRQPGSRHDGVPDDARERGDGRVVEHVAERESAPQRGVRARHHPRREQGVPAEAEEVVVHRHVGV